MTDIAAVVRGFGGVSALPGLDDAWTWSTGRMFSYALALTSDGAHAVQITMMGPLRTELAVSVLSYARENSPAVLAAAPFAVLAGWTPPAGAEVHFDVVAATIPAVHRYHEAKEPELNEVTYAVFPAYRCEFSGRETQREAEDRFDRMIEVPDLDRLATPWLRMRYDNPRTGGGSVGTELGLAWPDQLIKELRKLDGAEGAWIDFENFENKLRRASFDGELRLGDRPIGTTELVAYAQKFLFEGVGDDES